MNPGTFEREAAVPFSSEVLCARTRAEGALRHRQREAGRRHDGQDRTTHTEQLSVLPRQARNGGGEQHALGNSHRACKGHVTQEPHHLVDALVAAELSTDEEPAQPLAQVGLGLGWIRDMHAGRTHVRSPMTGHVFDHLSSGRARNQIRVSATASTASRE